MLFKFKICFPPQLLLNSPQRTNGIWHWNTGMPNSGWLEVGWRPQKTRETKALHKGTSGVSTSEPPVPEVHTQPLCEASLQTGETPSRHIKPTRTNTGRCSKVAGAWFGYKGFSWTESVNSIVNQKNVSTTFPRQGRVYTESTPVCPGPHCPLRKKSVFM